MTSNVGAKMITESKRLGFSSGEDKSQENYEESKKEIMQELKKEFRPEFINRIDEVIVFHKLEEDELLEITDLMLGKLRKRLEEQGIIVEIDESVKKLIIKNGSVKEYGARPIRRAIQAIVEDNITDQILLRKFKTWT